MNIIRLFFLIIFVSLLFFAVPRVLEIYLPIKTKKVTWQKLFDLRELNDKYIAQGVEIYKDYLLFSVHENDTKSHLIVFKIISNTQIIHLFTTQFPREATHISDFSVYNNYLYAIDYATNNLYKIDIEDTIRNEKLKIKETHDTRLEKSGSIIVTQYNNETILFVSQFILNDKISGYKLESIVNKSKKPVLSIESKFFIQGLYKDEKYTYISSNMYGNDAIFIIDSLKLYEAKKIDKNNSLAINGPGMMIEDITIFDDYIITSDEETNAIYISKVKISNIMEQTK